MGQGVLGRYAPIKQMQGSAQQAMGGAPDTGAVPPAAVAGLRAQMQSQPAKPVGQTPIGGALGTNGSALQALMGKMRGMNPALPGR